MQLKKQTDLYALLRKPLTPEGKKRKHQTEHRCARPILKRFLESWTTAVPPVRRS